MLRFLVGIPVVLAAVAVFAMWHATGEIEPCRALAVARAQSVPVSGVAEHWTRMQTSQMSSQDCAIDLFQRWWTSLTSR
ncbi:MAG TPA: hypothetical protein VGG48_09500 [Rhizomicrobium sp.]|jgi:hypothetical protein